MRKLRLTMIKILIPGSYTLPDAKSMVLTNT